MSVKHIEQVRKIQSIAQIGLEFSADPYDRERYEELRRLAAEMLADCSAIPAAQWQDLFEKETGYATPKVDVRGAVFREDKVLLCCEKADGCWSLPGGWADVNDPPSQAVIREVLEETGYEVCCTKLAAVLDRDLHYPEGRQPFHSYKLLFLCEIEGQQEGLCHDITEAKFFRMDQLPSLSLQRTLPMHIELLHEHWKNPALATVFD